jgi:hypothetical protein
MLPFPPSSANVGVLDAEHQLKIRVLASRDVHGNLEAKTHFLVSRCRPSHVNTPSMVSVNLTAGAATVQARPYTFCKSYADRDYP